MHKAEKILLLNPLVQKRKSQILPGFSNIGDFQDGVFDIENNISPWTNGACNVDSKLMLVGQDWASAKWLSDPTNKKYAAIGRNPQLTTNKNIDFYLDLFGLKFQDVYATNAFVHVKNGGMSGQIPTSVFNDSINTYLIPQIKIINPKIVVCLGAQTFNGLRKALGHQIVKINSGHINSISLNTSSIYGVFHPGGLGTAGAGGKEVAIKQWEYLANLFKKINGE